MPLFIWSEGNRSKLGFQADAPTGAEAVALNGLYDVYIDLEDDVREDDIEQVNKVLQCAWQQLWKHRSLCEDFVRINVIREMPFCLNAQIELCADADVNEVAGEIYYRVQEFLTPTIRFWNFKEMYENKGKRCDEIYEGPFLCNGFIDDGELDKANLRDEIYVSDLWQVIMDVCGVAGIKKLSIKNTTDWESQEATSDSKWCIKIDKFHKPVLDLNCSELSFQNEFDCIFPDKRKVNERMALLTKLNKPERKSMQPPSLIAGIDRNIEEYFTIQNDFPATYKIGDGQITEDDVPLRKAQARQLKGYLMLYDQLLADYLAQLTRVKDLLSISQPEEHTYFYQTLYDIPGVRYLIKDAAIKDFNIADIEELKTETDPAKRELIIRQKKEEWEDKWTNFTTDNNNELIQKLKWILESETKNKERKNMFLDHLLARFGEAFTEYVVKTHEEMCSCRVSSESKQIDSNLLKHKAAFLKRIPELSGERGKGFNYKGLDCGKPDVWDSANVAGLKKRVCMYLGFEDFNTKTLTCPPAFEIDAYRVISDGRVMNYRLRLVDDEKKVLLDGTRDYRSKQNTVKDAKDLREQILRGKIAVSAPDAKGFSRVSVIDREDNHALQSEMMRTTEAQELRNRIRELAFPETCSIEGFHIVEHILLRPKDDDYDKLFSPIPVQDAYARNYNARYPSNPITVEDILIADPYSFWITVVVPDWLPQFKGNVNAQYRFEQLVRRETPAHILVKFCWLDPERMYGFETAYLKWLYENALADPNERELTQHTNSLIEIMERCRFSIREIDNPCEDKSTRLPDPYKEPQRLKEH